MVFNPDDISYVLENHTKTQWTNHRHDTRSKKIGNDQELIQSDPISCPQNQKGK